MQIHTWPAKLKHFNSNAQQMTTGFKALMPDLSSQQAGGKKFLAAKSCLLSSRFSVEKNILCLCLWHILTVRLFITSAIAFFLDLLLNILFPSFSPSLNI